MRTSFPGHRTLLNPKKQRRVAGEFPRRKTQVSDGNGLFAERNCSDKGVPGKRAQGNARQRD
jgi:hypothetical protein